MRLSKIGLAATAVSWWLSSGYVFAADPRAPEIAGAVSDSIFARANMLAETKAGRIQSDFVDDFAEQARLAREGERIHMALAAPAVTQRLGPRQTDSAPIDASFDAQRPEQPSVWLMGGVILLLIGYQLRRKHRLLRPHRFHAL